MSSKETRLEPQKNGRLGIVSRWHMLKQLWRCSSLHQGQGWTENQRSETISLMSCLPIIPLWPAETWCNREPGPLTQNFLSIVWLKSQPLCFTVLLCRHYINIVRPSAVQKLLFKEKGKGSFTSLLSIMFPHLTTFLSLLTSFHSSRTGQSRAKQRVLLQCFFCLSST